MNHKFIQMLTIACFAFAAFCLPDPVRAAEAPRMNKAVELLREAKPDKHPVPLLEKAKTHVENTEHGNKGGRRCFSINKIEKAGAAAKSGKDAGFLIDEAIVLPEEGKEIQKSKRKKKGA